VEARRDLGVPQALCGELGDPLLCGCQRVRRPAPSPESALLGHDPGDPQGSAEGLERRPRLAAADGRVDVPGDQTVLHLFDAPSVAALEEAGRRAYGLAVDKSGNVYVADTDNHRIQVFSAGGGFLRKMTFAASESVQDVAIDVDGSVWGTSNQGTKAQQFSKSGGALEAITTPKLGLGLAVDQQGNVLVATAGDNIASVIRYDKASGYTAGKTLGGFRTPHDVEVSPDGSIYVSDNGSLTVKRFDANGKPLKTIKGGPSAPIGVGVDLDCNVWVTNISQRRIDRYSPTGKLLGSATSGDLIAQDVAIGPKGDLYAYDGNTHGVVRLAEDKSAPVTAAVGGVTVARKGARSVARIKYTAAGIACPAQLAATASLSGGASGKASVKVAAGKSTVIEIRSRRRRPAVRRRRSRSC
jgi:sugar lactone lactonase YvrE